MDERLWSGVGVALVTLFDAGGGVDVEATAGHAARVVAAGLGGVVVAGSTGENEALTDEERVGLVAGVRAACPGVVVVSGVGGGWVGPVVRSAAAVVAAGADAVLVAPPRRGTDLGVFFGSVADAVGAVPVMGYHYPGVAGGEVPVEEAPGLPLAAVKDSSGDPESLLRWLAGFGGAVYTGAAPLVSMAGALGAAGVILAVANVEPERCVAAWRGSAAAQRELLGVHLAVRGRFPHGVKEATAARWGTSTVTRLG